MILSRPWKTQPPAGTPINRGHPLSKKLVFAVNGADIKYNGSLRNLANPTQVATWDGLSDGTPTNMVRETILQGIVGGADSQGAAAAVNPGWDFGNNPITGSSSRTFLCGSYKTASESNNSCFALGANNTAERCSYRSDSGGLRVEIQGSGYTSSLTPTVGTFNIHGYRIDGTTLGDGHLYLNGVYEAMTGSTTLNTASDEMSLCSEPFGLSQFRTRDKILWAFAWSRALSDNEIESIRRNPWQMFQPRVLFFPYQATPASRRFIPLWVR